MFEFTLKSGRQTLKLNILKTSFRVEVYENNLLQASFEHFEPLETVNKIGNFLMTSTTEIARKAMISVDRTSIISLLEDVSLQISNLEQEINYTVQELEE